MGKPRRMSGKQKALAGAVVLAAVGAAGLYAMRKSIVNKEVSLDSQCGDLASVAPKFLRTLVESGEYDQFEYMLGLTELDDASPYVCTGLVVGAACYIKRGRTFDLLIPLMFTALKSKCPGNWAAWVAGDEPLAVVATALVRACDHLLMTLGGEWVAKRIHVFLYQLDLADALQAEVPDYLRERCLALYFQRYGRQPLVSLTERSYVEGVAPACLALDQALTEKFG